MVYRLRNINPLPVAMDTDLSCRQLYPGFEQTERPGVEIPASHSKIRKMILNVLFSAVSNIHNWTSITFCSTCLVN